MADPTLAQLIRNGEALGAAGSTTGRHKITGIVLASLNTHLSVRVDGSLTNGVAVTAMGFIIDVESGNISGSFCEQHQIDTEDTWVECCAPGDTAVVTLMVTNLDASANTFSVGIHADSGA